MRALDVAPSTFYKHRNRPLTEIQLRRQACWGATSAPQAINQKWCGDFKQVPTAEDPVFQRG